MPLLHKEGLIYAELDFNRVFEERQNFDPAGYYSRPDVTKLIVDRSGQTTVEFEQLDKEEEEDLDEVKELF